jgi:hypothetical protein
VPAVPRRLRAERRALPRLRAGAEEAVSAPIAAARAVLAEYLELRQRFTSPPSASGGCFDALRDGLAGKRDDCGAWRASVSADLRLARLRRLAIVWGRLTADEQRVVELFLSPRWIDTTPRRKHSRCTCPPELRAIAGARRAGAFAPLDSPHVDRLDPKLLQRRRCTWCTSGGGAHLRAETAEHLRTVPESELADHELTEHTLEGYDRRRKNGNPRVRLTRDGAEYVEEGDEPGRVLVADRVAVTLLHAEVAELAGCTERQVRSRLRSAYATVREAVSTWRDDDE